METEYGKSKSFTDITAYGGFDPSHLSAYRAMLNQRSVGNYNAAGHARDGYHMQGDGASMDDYMSTFMKEAGKMYGFTKALGEMMGYDKNGYGKLDGPAEYSTKHCATCSCKEAGMQSTYGKGSEAPRTARGIQLGANTSRRNNSGIESRLGKNYKN